MPLGKFSLSSSVTQLRSMEKKKKNTFGIHSLLLSYSFCNILYYLEKFSIHQTSKSGYKYALLSVYYLVDGFHMHRCIHNMPMYKLWLKYRCSGICSDTWKSKKMNIFLLILFHLFLYLTVDCSIDVVPHCENSIYCLGSCFRNHLNVDQTTTVLSKGPITFSPPLHSSWGQLQLWNLYLLLSQWRSGIDNGGCGQLITHCCSFLLRGTIPDTFPLLQHGVPWIGDTPSGETCSRMGPVWGYNS